MKNIFNTEKEKDYLANKEYIDINEINNEGNNALFGASFYKAGWLVKHGINIHNRNKKGQTAIFISSPKVVDLLIHSGIDVNAVDHEGHSALKTSNEQIQDLIIKSGFDFDKHNNLCYLDYKQTRSLLMVIDKENLNKITLNVHLQNKSNETLLFSACNKDVAQYLISRGIDINATDDDKRNALFKLKRLNFNMGVLEEVVKAGIDTSNVDNFGKNILFYVSTPDKIDTIIRSKNFTGINTVSNARKQSALFLASFPKTESLIKNGIEVNIVDIEGKNALFSVNDIPVARKLIDAGINIEQEDNEGNTAIFYASFACLKFLVECGANINHKNKKNETILDSVFGDMQKASFLIGKSINLDYLLEKEDPLCSFKGSVVDYMREKLIERQRQIMHSAVKEELVKSIVIKRI